MKCVYVAVYRLQFITVILWPLYTNHISSALAEKEKARDAPFIPVYLLKFVSWSSGLSKGMHITMHTANEKYNKR